MSRHGTRVPLWSKQALIRLLILATLVLGGNYIVWRYLYSVNWENWWIAVPLVLAETYSLIDGFLFGLAMWRIRDRGEPPPPPPDATVDVLITTYNEPIDLVATTARAAAAIRYPHRTWILDDGARPEMREAAEALGVGYLTRSDDWADRPRHAKAGNLNNALFATEGEFLLILDADQIPDPRILDRTLGYFDDHDVALVQTPQWFSNVTEADPLGSQAPLFYGPIQQGKDGWNAAFFCGSNAVVRREALMQLGIVGYVREVERGVRRALRSGRDLLRQARRDALAAGSDAVAALDRVRVAVDDAMAALDAGHPVAEVTYRFQRTVDDAARGLVASDVDRMRADLAAIGELPTGRHGLDVAAVDDEVLDQLSAREWSPLGAIESVRALVGSVDVDRGDEAQPVMPMATISVTEDMATAMRLHAFGWRSVFHHEILASGLAPEDLGTMLHQRLRWAQGTLQVMLRENPLVQRGLSWGQRLMYFATMWSYLSGFAALVYIAAPVIYLCFGVKPVQSFGGDFLSRLIPFLVVNQLLFLVVGWGIKTWRGQQYSLALFPLWIRATTTAVANVLFGRSLGFVVTSKERRTGGPSWGLIRPQLIAMGLLVAAAVIGTVRAVLGFAPTVQGTVVNVAWVIYDLVVLSVVVQAVRFRGSDAEVSEEEST
ncbi:glycosyltransferase [Actinomycetospora straminea]|uniref:Glycosyltransferase n=1 Tax=Actinomycetospora straminea TaxID=663607 RepID=A0ABP9EW17_9PSEU|nr:glycosyltransferase [Actinomycetospora straminea]MDD7932965.1 glycosyltransferase [Actinomycetospora straminea]